MVSVRESAKRLFVSLVSAIFVCAPAAASTQARVPESRAVASVHTLATATGATLLSEGFSSSTTVNAWTSFNHACLTAGVGAAPTLPPPCQTAAPQDAIGQGTLQLAPPSAGKIGVVVANTPLSTANGLQVTFDYDAFDGTSPGGQGTVFFFTDASKPFPTTVGGNDGSLSYAPGGGSSGVANAYVGIGLDEYGEFSNGADGLNGGPGKVPETIAVRGSAATNYQYIGGATNAAGQPASLPFALDAPTATTRPSSVPTVRAQLTPRGLLSVAIDRHDGNGFVVYYSQNIVGVNGQPAVPANVYFGIGSANGTQYEAAQISGLVVSALTQPVAATTLVSEPFTAAASTPGLWTGFGGGCLTAGTAATPATSLPACGKSAPQDPAGGGALQLTKAGTYLVGAAIANAKLSTAAGLQITFTDAAFKGTTPGEEGVALVLTDAAQPFPTSLGDEAASMGYASTKGEAGLPGAYLGVGLDEFGDFSSYSTGSGGPGPIPETVTVRGAAISGYPYLGSVLGSNGAPTSLPFMLDSPTATSRPPTAPTVRVTLTAAGVLTVAIDHHDGNGFVTYFVKPIVGIAGQPAVPANVFVGLTASTGGHDEVHQITNFAVTTLGTAPVATAPDNDPPQLVSSNGSLTFNVSATVNPTTGFPQLAYNGSTIPPTLRLLPGDTLVVNVTDELPVPPTGAGYTNDVNVHYHGLHVSPQAPGDDAIDMLAAPGQSLHYTIQLPVNHPTGLYWYHGHVHGEAERDTLAGMSGALIVDGIAASTPQVANLTERVLVLRDAPLPGTPLPNADLAQTFAMRWAMQHGVAMHAAGPGASATARAASAYGEYHAASTMRANNPYVAVNPNFRHFVRPTAADTHCVAGSPEPPVHAYSLNGQSQPALRIAPGEVQFWRVVNAGADTYFDFSVDNTQLQIVALDGVPLAQGTGTPAAMTVADWVLPPASRAEFLITGPPAGTPAYIRTNCFDAGPSGDPMPAQILGSIDPTAAASAKPARTAARVSPRAVRFAYHTSSAPRPNDRGLRSAKELRAATITATRTLYYSDQNDINGIAYDPAAAPMFYSQTGSVEQWTIQNESAQVHTFHIHQVHFLVQAINGVAQAQQYLLDNVNVPAATASGPGSVTLLLDFTDPTIIGTFLLHCHILSHEDGGMMAKIRIGIAPPLVLSASSIAFASPTAGEQTVTISGGAAPYSISGCSGVASASIKGATITALPGAAGSCVLTIADSSSPSITTTLLVQVTGVPPIVTLAPVAVGFTAPSAAAQRVTISGGTAPYSATGCSAVAAAAVSGQTIGVTPLATGACSLLVTDAKANTATLSVTVNGVVTANPLDNITFHQNAMRTGWYPNETTLTTANVNPATFGQIATIAPPAGMPALGKMYGQPLFVTKEKAVDGNLHNLLVVAGAAAQIYAFDETTHAVVWHRDFTNAAAGVRAQLWSDSGCSDINPEDAIVGTPVIDRSLDRLYVVVGTVENGVPYLRLHAIGLGTGVDATAPTVISGSVTLATGGIAAISPLGNMNRAALLEADGNIYVSLGSHCDLLPATTHGWEIAYNAITLQETGNLVDFSNANDGSGYFLGSVWMSGFGPAADAQGNIYFATGNGPFNGLTNFAMSVLKLPGNLNIGAASYFTPIQEEADSSADDDLGSGGVMLLPDQPGTYPHLLIAGGKCSTNFTGCFKYLLNRDNLGGQQMGNAGAVWTASTGHGMWGGPAYFVDATGQPHIVYGGPINTYNLTTAPYNLTIQSTTNVGCLECRDAGSQPIVSSNGTTAGSAVVWALQTPGNSGGTITLYAFPALAMGTALFSAPAGTWVQTPGTQWIAGALISPLVVNGRVYVATDNSISVFGLLSSANRPAATMRKP